MSIFEIRSFLGLAGYHRRFENGLKWSIRGRIIEREIEDTWNTRDTSVGS